MIPQSIIEYYKKYHRDNANYSIQKLMGTKFDLDTRYQLQEQIGRGAYGIVVAAIDNQAKTEAEEFVAIKKIERAFEHKIFTKRTLRELKILRLLKHENINSIKNIILPPSREEFDDIYVVSEMMETDLAQILKSPQDLTDEHFKFFMYQILRGLKYMHSANVLHRDLVEKIIYPET